MADGSRPDSPLTGADRDRTAGEILSSARDAPPAADDAGSDGTRRFGRYSVHATLARGGMGEVLEAWDPSLRRYLALKVMRTAGETVDERARARFLEEAQIGGRLDHPGIVPVHDLGHDEEGQPYFTMRLVEGHTLQQILERLQAGDEEWNHVRVLGILLKVCEAMAFAHDRGVVHRDLKPANVMVGPYGEVYVMDWGLAHRLEEDDPYDLRPVVPEVTVVGDAASDDSPLLTMRGDVIGTPAFMSPEQALGRSEQLGPGTDVYAVGAILYQLATGAMPYVTHGERVSASTIWDRVRGGPPRAVSELAPSLPAELVSICEKAMAREVGDRYADMAALARDLRAFLEGRVVSAHRTGAVAEFRKWVSRNRPVAATIAASLAIVVVGSLATTAVLAAYNEALTRTRDLALARRIEAEDALARESRARLEAEGAAEREETARVAAEAATLSEAGARREAEASAEREAEARREAEVATAREAVARRKAEAAETEARWQAYRANIAAAAADLQLGDLTAAAERLDACDPELAGWERDVLQLRHDPALQTWTTGSEDHVRALAVSPDGRRVVSGGTSGSLSLRDLASGELLAQPPLVGYIRDIVYTPDGRRLVVAEGDATLAQRDADTGALLMRLRGHGGLVTAVATSPDGTRLASASEDGTVRVWDAATGETLAVLPHDGPVESLAFAPDGAWLATGGERGVVHLWDAVTMQRSARLVGHGRSVAALAFAPSGELLASGGMDDRVRLWDLVTGRSRHVLETGGEVNALAFAPDGERLAAACGDGTLRVFDLEGEERAVLRGHLGAVYDVGFTHGGTELLSASADGTLRTWDESVKVGAVRLPLLDDVIAATVLSADGTLLAAGSFDGSIRILDARSGDPLHWLEGHDERVMSLAFALDGRRLASTDDQGNVLLWDARRGVVLAPLREGAERIAFVTASPDGRRIAVTSGGRGNRAFEDRRLLQPLAGEREIELYDAETGRPLLSLPGQRYATAVAAFSGDGRRLVSGSQAGGIAVWDPESGELLATLATEPVRGGTLDLPPVSFLAVDETGKTIVSAHLSRLTSIVVWDGETGERRHELRGHDRRVWSVALTPDGRRVLSTGEDRTVRVWDTGTGAQLLTLREPRLAGLWVTLRRDGRRLLSSTSDGAVVVWDIDVEDLRQLWAGTERRAAVAPIVDELLAEHVLPSIARSQVVARSDLPPEWRRTIDRLLVATPVPSTGELNRQAWQLVASAGRSAEEYRRALTLSEVASARSPDNAALLNTLGVALYRAGRPADALETLRRADAINSVSATGYDRAGDRLVMVMCLAELGRIEEARDLLAETRLGMQAGADGELLEFAAEAEAILADL